MNQTTNELQLLRKNEVMTRIDIAKTTLYDRIQKGLFPPPIALSSRCSVWPAHEVDFIIQAIISGTSESDQKMLVQKLITQREELKSRLLLKP